MGIPAGLLGSAVFNDYPRPLHIAGTREQYHDLFEQLATAPDAAATNFERYMETRFQLAGHDDALKAVGPRRFRADYRRLLRGWGFDANSREGAVLKAWVENRFGLFPIFHKQALTRVSSPAWGNYVEEKMSSRFHNNIFLQLDLLYEFCQWVLARRRTPGRHLMLYRGVNDFIEHPLIRKNRGREIIVRLNNLVSFTADRTVACEFGDTILEARVPKVKILFFSELLPRHPLKGEAEYLVIGGDYRVNTSYL